MEDEDTRGEKPPLETLYIPGNASVAALLECIKDNGGKGVIMETEADTLTSSTEQSWGDFSHLLRQAFHHEAVLLARKEGKVRIDEPKLSIVLTGTSGQLKRLVKSTENGLFSRFIFYVFRSDAGWIDQFSQEKNQYHSMISTLSPKLYTFRSSQSTLSISIQVLPKISNANTQPFSLNWLVILIRMRQTEQP